MTPYLGWNPTGDSTSTPPSRPNNNETSSQSNQDESSHLISQSSSSGRRAYDEHGNLTRTGRMLEEPSRHSSESPPRRHRHGRRPYDAWPERLRVNPRTGEPYIDQATYLDRQRAIDCAEWEAAFRKNGGVEGLRRSRLDEVDEVDEVDSDGGDDESWSLGQC